MRGLPVEVPAPTRSAVPLSPPENALLLIAHGDPPTLNLGKHGRFGGTRLSELGYDFGVLLGRDFLLSAQMVYDGRTGSVVVSDDTPMYPPM